MEFLPAKRLMHAVVFWLRADAPDGTAAEMAKFYREEISQVAGVEQVFVGEPVGTDRDVVDGSEKLMSSLVFTDGAAAAAWQTDPVHATFRDRFEKRSSRASSSPWRIVDTNATQTRRDRSPRGNDHAPVDNRRNP